MLSLRAIFTKTEEPPLQDQSVKESHNLALHVKGRHKPCEPFVAADLNPKVTALGPMKSKQEPGAPMKELKVGTGLSFEGFVRLVLKA